MNGYSIFFLSLIYLSLLLNPQAKVLAQEPHVKNLPGNVKIMTFSPQPEEVIYPVSKVNINSTNSGGVGRLAATPQFIEINPAGFNGAYFSPSQWVDFDNDNDLDFIVSGSNDNNVSVIITTLYQNDGNDLFVEASNTGIPILYQGTISWSDYDNDGDMDMFYAGLEPVYPYKKISGLLKNNGTLPLQEIPFEFTPLYNSASLWGDIDNDGDMDLVVSGYEFSSSASSSTDIYRNDGGDMFTKIETPVKYEAFGNINLIDVDNDSDLDLYVTDNQNIYINNGFFQFTEVSIMNTVYSGSASDWVDYNGDGYYDLIISGLKGGQFETQIYRNLGNLTFEPATTGLPGVLQGDVRWADHDNDGDYDFILSGQNEQNPVTKIYNNDGAGNFSEQLGETFPQLFSSTIDWGDYDNDGDLDLLLSGSNDFGVETKVFKNDGIVENTAPDIPANLQTSVNYSTVSLTWDNVSDAQSSSESIIYNLRIGTQPGAIDVLTPHASLSSGFNKGVNQINGGLQEQWIIEKLPIGTYYWSVQAIDPGFMPSLFSTEGTFEITQLSPPRSPDNLTVRAVSSTVTSLNWDDVADDEDEYHIERSTTSLSGSFNPVASLTANSTSFLDNGLSPGTGYYYRIYASNQWGNTSPTDPVFVTTPLAKAPSHLTAIGTASDVSLEWQENSNDEVNVIVERSSQPNTGYAEAARLASNATTFVDLFVEHKTTYYYRVGVLDVLGNKVYSDYIEVTTPAFFTYTEIEAFEKISSRSAAWSDYDNDGDMDALINCRLYKNNGNKTFTRIYYSASPDNIDQGQCLWGDFNNDKLTDIVIFSGACQIQVAKNMGQDQFTTFYESSGNCKVTPLGLLDFNNDGYLDIFTTGYNLENHLLINQNGVTFTELTSGNIITRNKDGLPWVVAIGDLDNNGFQDIIIGVWNNSKIIYMNNGDGTFSYNEQGDLLLDTQSASTISLGDYDNDGDLDLFAGGVNKTGYSSIYTNDGNGIFSLLANGSFSNMEDASSSSWVDFDLDGDLDLFIVKSLNSNTYLYQNNGASGFKEIALGDIEKEKGVGTSAAFADYDRDGDQDFYEAVGQDGYDNFMENAGNSNNWINIKLEGYKTNYSAIGAKIKLKANGNWQYREILSITGFNSQNSLNQVFGLKSTTVIDSIVVYWPLNLKEQVLTNVEDNQFLVVKESDIYPPETPASFTSQALSTDSISLAWVSNVENESGFIIERSVNDTLNYAFLDEVPGNVAAYNDTLLTPFTTYYYRIKGYNELGESEYLKTQATTHPLAPEAPDNLVVTIDAGRNISLVWVDNSISEDGFIIEKSKGDNSTFQNLDSLPKNTQSYSYIEASLPTSQSYFYRIKSYNITGESAYSNESSLLITLIEDSKNSIVEVYPNPASGALNIAFGHKSMGEIDVQIFSLSGQLMMRQRKNKTSEWYEGAIDIIGLPQGTYLMEISIDNESVFNHRFIRN